MNETSTAELKQPPVIKLSTFMATFERSGFYVLVFLLVLYLKGEYQFSDSAAFVIFGVFSALAYLATAAGGYLADNIFGIRRCIILGLAAEAAGLFLISIPIKALLPLSLALVIAGVGLFKTGPTHLMGRSYKEKDSRIDSGFTIYYVGMNVGNIIVSSLIGTVIKYFGWHVAFLFGGVLISCALIVYYFLKGTATELDSRPGMRKLSLRTWAGVLVGFFVSIGIFAFLVNKTSLAQEFLTIASLCLLGYFIYQIIKSPSEEKKKIIASLLLIIMGLVFFILYQQAYMSMVLFINRSVSREFFGMEIPTVAFFALNPIWVVVLGPLLAIAYKALGNRGKNPAVTVKFPIGLLLAGLCFICLVVGAQFADANGLVSPWWVVLAYLFYSAGELLVSALGVAMVTHIAPKRMYGVMMGTWFVVGMSLSSVLGSYLAGFSNIPENLHDGVAVLHIYTKVFLEMGVGALILTAISFLVGPLIKRMAKL